MHRVQTADQDPKQKSNKNAANSPTSLIQFSHIILNKYLATTQIRSVSHIA